MGRYQLNAGGSGSGTLTNLIAKGALDQYLSHNANFTFWKVRYNKHTNFAMESVAQPFNTTVQFGNMSQITLNRNGDLIYHCYVVVEIPGIVACDGVGEGGGSSCGVTGGVGQFPSTTNPCMPCRELDYSAVEEYLQAGDVPVDLQTASADVIEEAYRKARSEMRRVKLGICAPDMSYCDAEEDCPDEIGDVWAHWTNNIGQFLIKSATIVIGGSTIDTLYNDFLFMWEELTGKSGKRLTEMTGKRYNRVQLICDSRKARTLYVPLPFWFTQHSGQALALASLQFHGVQLHIEFSSLQDCICVSKPGIVVKNCATGAPLTNNDLQCFLETTYVYLDTVERERFSTQQYEVLIVQNQRHVEQNFASSKSIALSFNHPVIELMWAVRRECHARSNNWTNLSGVDGLDPVEQAALYLNNQPRFTQKPGTWFRLVQPYQHHSSIPEVFVYVYSFALHPEDPSPSGSVNMSRIDHVELRLQLQDELSKETTTIMIFARNWNVLRFTHGLGGVAYAN